MTRFLAILAAVLFTTTAAAQQYPDRTDPGVNDFANIIDSITEARLVTKLAEIAEDHDTELSIVTLSSLRFYANDSTIDDYATELFNRWGVGDAADNTGILMLVFRDDRELRIEVGEGYGDAVNAEIEGIIRDDIVPEFRDDKYPAGIEAGVNSLLARVIDAPVPAAASTPSSSDDAGEGSGNTLYYILGAVAVAIAGLFGLNRRNAAKFAAQPCSNCGKTGLEKSREVLKEATLEDEGRGETRISCPACGHVDATPYTISKLRPKEPSGGGKSDGDGATGKW